MKFQGEVLYNVLNCFFYTHNSEMLSLNERQKLDRRRAEDAFFQYAILTWYPDYFNIQDLPLHASTMKTVTKFTEKYHEAFMDRYSGTANVYGCF